MTLTLAGRTRNMTSSAIREILKLTERPGVLSMAGGLPSPDGFPLEALARASERVWRTQGAQAMQYASSEGLLALRAWLAQRISRPHWQVQPDQVLVTTGSQQGLDLCGKVLVDPGSRVLVEQPSYLGALQALSVYEPEFVGWSADAQGPLPEPLQQVAGLRAAYLVPSFQNPSGHLLGGARRQALADALRQGCATLIEDNPYGELWYDTPPADPVVSLAPAHGVVLGSLSKILAPGLRLGYIVVPPLAVPGARALQARLVQAKQAADLHTPGFNQRLVLQLLEDGFELDAHVARVRARYRAQRDAMAQALSRHLSGTCAWQVPQGGMFFWVQGPVGWDAGAWLSKAVEAGVAYVPGAAFHTSDVQAAQRRWMRLSFVTLAPEQIQEAVARLAALIGQAGAQGC
jgi:2-aminoadipate transaminase